MECLRCGHSSASQLYTDTYKITINGKSNTKSVTMVYMDNPSTGRYEYGTSTPITFMISSVSLTYGQSYIISREIGQDH